MKKALIIFGTRPEAIKMAPLVHEFLENRDFFETKVCVTAQHREMLDQVLDFFDIKPDYDLDIMRHDQNLHSITAEIITGIKPILEEFGPDYVFVHGDTTTSMATSLSAFYSGVKVCHIEAGLRTYNKKAPFPEEINRQITSRITDFHFAPTEKAKLNLLNEQVPENQISVTGNTVIDALLKSVEKVNSLTSPIINKLKQVLLPGKDLILVTGHRRENFGQGFLDICKALGTLSEDPEVQIVYPVHLNPHVQKPVYEILGHRKNIHLMDPLPYEAFVWLMNRCKIIITDSGGVQEEAPSLGKPVLVMRETTERPEAVDAGTVLLVGTNADLIINETRSLLSDKTRYENMSRLHNPYGDGKACPRIIEFLKKIDQN